MDLVFKPGLKILKFEKNVGFRVTLNPKPCPNYNHRIKNLVCTKPPPIEPTKSVES